MNAPSVQLLKKMSDRRPEWIPSCGFDLFVDEHLPVFLIESLERLNKPDLAS
jgi:hypothetical protein